MCEITPKSHQNTPVDKQRAGHSGESVLEGASLVNTWSLRSCLSYNSDLASEPILALPVKCGRGNANPK